MKDTHNPQAHKGPNGYGFKPDHHDKSKDWHYGATGLYIDFKLRPKMNPSAVDLSSQPQPPIYDQGQLGSCTANAAAAMLGFVEAKEGNTPEEFSRLFMYWKARAMEGDVANDSGAAIADVFAGIAAKGAPLEALWPYDISKFSVEAPHNVWGNAWQRIAGFNYYRIQTLADMKNCLSAGYPFEFGISVYDSFESDRTARTGFVPIPNVNAESFLGGHALCCVGFDDKKSMFLFRNSWGIDWGLNGLAWIPYEYMTDPNLASDMWTVRKVHK